MPIKYIISSSSHKNPVRLISLYPDFTSKETGKQLSLLVVGLLVNGKVGIQTQTVLYQALNH